MYLRCRKYLTRLNTKLYTYLVPTGLRWRVAQRRYVKWAEEPLPSSYIEYVRIMGEEFSTFVGTPTRLIDVGCGNGVFNGVGYAEAGYLPLKKRGGYILGVDPLPLVNPIPWLSEFKQGRIEDLELSGFNEAAFVTTFDHIENIDAALTQLKRAGVKTLFIWETIYKRHTRGDMDHPHHYIYAELAAQLQRHSFKITRADKKDENKDTEGWFIEAKRP